MKRLLRRVVKVPNLSWLMQGIGGSVLAGAGFRLGEDIYRAVKKRVAGPEEPPRAEPSDRDQYRG